MKTCCAVLPTVARESSELREPRLVSVTQTLTDAVKLRNEDVASATSQERRWDESFVVVW